MVEESTMSVPAAAASSMPLLHTARVSLPAGSMVTTTSASLTASATDAALATPRATALSMLAATMSKPFTWCPCLTRLPAMGTPMLPSPMKPILVIVLSRGSDPSPPAFASLLKLLARGAPPLRLPPLLQPRAARLAERQQFAERIIQDRNFRAHDAADFRSGRVRARPRASGESELNLRSFGKLYEGRADVSEPLSIGFHDDSSTDCALRPIWISIC